MHFENLETETASCTVSDAIKHPHTTSVGLQGSGLDTGYEYMIGKSRDRSLDDYERILNLNIRARIAELLKQKGSARVLDVGCGQGKALQQLEAHYKSPSVELVGLDLHTYPGTSFRNINTGTIEQDQSVLGRFDLIFSTHAFRYVKNKLAAMHNVASMLDEDTGSGHINLASDLIQHDADKEKKPDAESEDENRIEQLLHDFKYGEAISYNIPLAHRPQYGLSDRMEYGTFRILPQASNVAIPQYKGEWNPAENTSYSISYYAE